MNDDVPLGLLFGLLIVLLLLSASFSIIESALARNQSARARPQARGAARAFRRLVLASALPRHRHRVLRTLRWSRHGAGLAAGSVATLLTLALGGNAAELAGALLLLLVALLALDAAPGTIAARLATPGSTNMDGTAKTASPSAATGAVLAQRSVHEVPEIAAITVDDVMVPRQEIVGVDLDREWPHNLEVIRDCPHERLPVYRDDIDNIIGVVRTRRLLPDLAAGKLTEARLLEETREADFVPEGTPLSKQLPNFQQQKRRSAFVVDEYGDVQGLITAEDILRELVGELDTEPVLTNVGVAREHEGSYLVDASTNIRRLNRLMSWRLPTDGPKTLNGLIVEQLETIPEPGTKLVVNGYLIEILNASEHGIRQVRVLTPAEDALPPLRAAEG